MKAYHLLLAFALPAVLCSMPSASGAYAPQVSVSPEQQNDVNKAQRAIKSMSEKDRRLFLAYRLGLLIKPSEGGWAYYDHLDDNFDSEAALYAVSDEAHAVLPGGKLVPFSDAAKKLSTKKCQEAARAIAKVGDSAVCVAFAKDVEALVKALTHHYFSLFYPACRDAFLAMLEDAVFDAQGNPLQPSFAEKDVMGVRNAKFKYPNYPSDAKFKDREGKEQNLQDTLKSLQDKNLHAAVDHLFWCVSLIGKEDIVAELNKVEKEHSKGKKSSEHTKPGHAS